VVGRIARWLERGLAGLRKRPLQIRIAEQLRCVASVIDHFVEAFVHERDVKALEVVLDVERPVRIDLVVAVTRRIMAIPIDGKPREPIA
jgi:hypothetical protein